MLELLARDVHRPRAHIRRQLRGQRRRFQLRIAPNDATQETTGPERSCRLRRTIDLRGGVHRGGSGTRLARRADTRCARPGWGRTGAGRRIWRAGGAVAQGRQSSTPRQSSGCRCNKAPGNGTGRTCARLRRSSTAATNAVVLRTSALARRHAPALLHRPPTPQATDPVHAGVTLPGLERLKPSPVRLPVGLAEANTSISTIGRSAASSITDALRARCVGYN